jgi:hypothetical protein
LAAAELDPSIAIILYVEERDYSHWSVFKSLNGSRVTLFDSDGMSTASLKRCEPWLVLGEKRRRGK